MQTDKPDCTLLILTYKGRKHLEHLLPTVAHAVRNMPGHAVEVLIVDNGCCQETRQYVRETFPAYRYEFSSVNAYLFSLNHFVAGLSSDFVFILNDDMKLHPDVLRETVPFMKNDPSLFAVTCNIMDWDGQYSTLGVAELRYQLGWALKKWVRVDDGDPRFTLFAGGGAALFRTSAYNQLGGFDDLFYPAYAEDLDLGHRAWHSGLRIIYNPKAVLYHREGGTIKDQFRADKLAQKIYGHQILWMVKNADRPFFLLAFFLMLPYRLLTGWKVSRNSYLALWGAVTKFPKALLKRMNEPRPAVSDVQIMNFLGTKYSCNGNG